MVADIGVETEDPLPNSIMYKKDVDHEKGITISRLSGRFVIKISEDKTLLSSIPINKCCIFGHKYELIAVSTSQVLCWREGEAFPGRMMELCEYICDLASSDTTLIVMSTAHFWIYNARMELVRKVNHTLGSAKMAVDDCNVIWVGDKAGRVYKLIGSKVELVKMIPASIQEVMLKDSRIQLRTIRGWHMLHDQEQG